jgi:hypothetical protein
MAREGEYLHYTGPQRTPNKDDWITFGHTADGWILSGSLYPGYGTIITMGSPHDLYWVPAADLDDDMPDTWPPGPPWKPLPIPVLDPPGREPPRT